MKNKNVGALLRCAALILAAAIPFVAVAALIAFLPGAFGYTFVGELNHKVTRLETVEEPKIVILGGSSVAFGLSTPLLEEMTGMPVVNFGLYATLGTKLMMDLSRHTVGEGDVIVLAPELDAQTLSLYFNAESTFQGMDGHFRLLRYLGRDNYTDMLGGAASFLSSKLNYLMHGIPDPEGVYNHYSFDAKGDIYYPRPYNVMNFWYDIGKPLSFTPDLYSQEFIDYVNDYVAFCGKQGAKVCYSFPPMNASAIAPGTTEESYAELYAFLCRSLDCEIIGSPENYIMEAKYFYDSNFHPNTAGAQHHTAHLGTDLRRFLGLTGIYTVELPEPEERPADFGKKPTSSDVTGEGDLWSELYTYTERLDTDGNLLGYTVSGLAETARGMTAIEIPQTYNGMPVVEIAEKAFADSTALRTVTIRDNIVAIASGAFNDCPTLAEISIYNEDSSTMIVDQTELFAGMTQKVTILLHSEKSYDSYVTGYFWANYGSMMKLAQ